MKPALINKGLRHEVIHVGVYNVTYRTSVFYLSKFFNTDLVSVDFVLGNSSTIFYRTAINEGGEIIRKVLRDYSSSIESACDRKKDNTLCQNIRCVRYGRKEESGQLSLFQV